MRSISKVLWVLMVVACLMVPFGGASGDRAGKIVTVGDGMDCETIQEAVSRLIFNSVNPEWGVGNTISISEGTYRESIAIPIPMTLKAAEGENVTIEGNVEVLSDDVIIEGLNFKGINALSEGSIYGIFGTYYHDLSDNEPFLEENRISTRLDKRIDLTTYAECDPIQGYPGNDHYSVRWSGHLSIPETGNYTFYLTIDDGGSLTIDGSTTIDEANYYGPAAEYSGSMPLEDGIHTIQVDYINKGYGGRCELKWESDGGIEKELVPLESFICSPEDHESNGIFGTYYDDDSYDVPFVEGQEMLTRLDKGIDIYTGHSGTGTSDPVRGHPGNDHYSVRWLGNLVIPETDIYSFYIGLAVQDGVALILDGERIIDMFTTSSNWNTVSGSKELEAGLHTIQVDFICGGYQGRCRLEWESSGLGEATPIERCIVPETAFSWNLRSPFLESGGVVTRLKSDGTHVNNLSVRECAFYDCLQGVHLFNAWSSTVEHCEFHNVHQGIVLNTQSLPGTTEMTSKENNVIDCTVKGHVGDGGEAVVIFHSSGNTVQGCTINGNDYGIHIREGDWNTVDTTVVTDSGTAVEVFGSSDNTVLGCTMERNDRGIHFYGGERNTVAHTTIFNSGTAVEIIESSNNTVMECPMMQDNEFAINITGGCFNRVNSTTIKDTHFDAVHFERTANSWVASNTVTGTKVGKENRIYLTGCTDFTIRNNIVRCVQLDASTNGYLENNAFEQSSSRALLFTGDDASHYDHHLDSADNRNYILTSDGTKRYIYYEYDFDGTDPDDNSYDFVTEDAGAIIFAHSSNVAIDATVRDGDGIWIVESTDCTVKATVENCIYGVRLEGSLGTVLQDSIISTSIDRSLYPALHVIDGDAVVRDTDIDASRTPTAPAIKLENGAEVSTYNTTFDFEDVDVTTGGTSEDPNKLTVHHVLTVAVTWADLEPPLPPVDVEIEDRTTDEVVYCTAHFGGTDFMTNGEGLAATDMVCYDFTNSDTRNSHAFVVTVWTEVDAEWNDSRTILEMTGSRREEFVVSDDIQAPASPTGLQVTIVPGENALELTWNEGGPDVETFSIYWGWQGGGDPVLLANVATPSTSYRVTDGLVDGTSYSFQISAWDDVPLESEISDAVFIMYTIPNNPPSLSQGAMEPETGNVLTEFVFTVVYTDMEGDNGTVWIYIDDERFEMTADPSDGIATDGVLYTHMTKLARGTHTFYFEAETEDSVPAVGPSAGPSAQQTTSDIKKKSEGESPGPGATIAVMAMITVTIVMGVARTRRD